MNTVLRQSYQAYAPRPLGLAERGDVTILFGGLTWRAERALEGLFEGCGYNARSLPPATRADLLKGRELIDIGQCCPTAFTTGNLMNFLQKEAARIGAEAVTDRYVFVTAGGCGACRFGQYHQSYELALSNLGLERLRLFLVQQNRFDQSDGLGGGLQADPHMLLGAVAAVALTDIIQDVEYQIRPYEVEAGATDRAVRLAVEEIHESMVIRPRNLTTWRSVLWHLTTGHFAKALRRARQHFGAIALDRLQVKPMVKITGEFYLATVEGEPNYDIHRWLEQEGAEVYPSAVSVFLDYVAHFTRAASNERGFFRGAEARNAALLRMVSRLFRARYDSFRLAFGGVARRLPDQAALTDLARPFYEDRLNGGEGHLLIGKAIWTHVHRKAHMICELSPYGCLPNTMSIGAMANVLGAYPDMLYAPLEIKGDSEVHALSRCQMILTEAKERAAEEMDRALAAAGLTLDQARQQASRRPEFASPFWKVPHRGAAGTAANVVLELGGARL